MTRLKRLLAAIISVIMILSVFSVGAFAYTDVNTGTSEGAAVDVLSQLELLKGYEDGTFRPESSITRAEFAAVVVRALGLESAAESMKGATPFTDVPANHWAAGYINLASSSGVINGRGNGIFDPSSNVLFEEAVKMVMAALGYTPAAESSGGYPGGFITVAAGEGVLDRVGGTFGSQATRGCVAQLVFNALEVPIMSQVGFGTNTTYEKSSSVLLDKLDVEKVEGRVTKIPGSADTRLLSYQVEYTVLKRYEISGNNRILRTVNQILPRVDAGVTNAQDYLEQYTYAYIKDIDDEPVIMSIVPKTGKNDKQVIYADEINFSKLSTLSNGRLYYYTDYENTKTSYIKIDTENLSCYYNGKKIDDATVLTLRDAINGKTTFSSEGINGYIEFIGDADGDGYNVAYIVDYLDMVVDDIRSSTYSVYDDGMVGRIYLDEEESDYTFKIMKNNKAVGFDDIEVGDFLSICGNLEDKYLTNGTVYITNDYVIGEIDGIDEERSLVYIDSEPYGYKEDVKDSIKLGTTGTFHLNMAGKVSYVSKETLGSMGVFGFMTVMGETGTLTSAPQARILDDTGVWKTYDFAARVAVNGKTGIKASEIISNWDTYKPDDWTDCGTNTSSRLKVYSLVSYELNAAGEIREINFNLKDKNVTEDEYAYVDFSGNYYAAANSVGSVFLKPNTSVFSINGSASERYSLGESDITVSTVDVLNNYESYSGRAFVMTKDYSAYAIAGYNIAGRVTYSDSIMIVKGVSKVMGTDRQIITRLEGYQGGEKITLDYSDIDTEITDKTGLSLANKNIKVGDVIMYSGSSSMANKIHIMMRPSEAISGNWVTNPYSSTGNVTYFSDSSSGKTVKFMFGLVRNRSGSRVTIALDDTVELSYDNAAKTFTGSASGVNVYIYDALNYVNPRVKDGAVGDLDYDKNADGTPYSDEGAFVMLRVENDITIKDIVMIKGLKSSSLKDTGIPQVSGEVTEDTKLETSEIEEEDAKEDVTETKTETETTTEEALAESEPEQKSEETTTSEKVEEEKTTEEPVAETDENEITDSAAETNKEETPQYETVTGTSYVVAGTTITAANGQQVLVNNKLYTVGTNAFSSVSAAVDAVSANGTVYVLGSTYNEDVRVNKAVTIEGDKNVYINGTFAVNVKGVTLKNLNIIYNRTTAGEPAVLLADSLAETDVTLSGCNLLDSQKGKDAVAIKVNKPASAVQQTTTPTVTEDTAEQVIDEEE